MPRSGSSTPPRLPEHMTKRLLRSITEPLRFLHRSDAQFFILGATGNVYTVTLSATPHCTCPDPTTPCKHIFFVYFRVLSFSTDDPCARRRTLRPCQLRRLLSAPISRDSFAEEEIRLRFLEKHNPICLDEMVVGGRRVVACGACKNPIHEECLMKWKKQGSRTCVICRANWKEIDDEDGYINLSAYVSQHHFCPDY